MSKLLRLIQVLTLVTIILLISVIVMQTYINKNTIFDENLLDEDPFTLSSFTTLYDQRSLWIEKSQRSCRLKVYDNKTQDLKDIPLSYFDYDILIHDLYLSQNKLDIISRAGKYCLIFSIDLEDYSLSKRELPFTNKDTKYQLSKTMAFSIDKKTITYYDLLTSEKNDLHLSNAYRVNKIITQDNLIYMVGQKAINQTLKEGSYAFYACYDKDANLLFEYSVKEDSKSTLLDILPIGGNFILFGKSSDKGAFFFQIDKNGQIQASSLFSENEGFYMDNILEITEEGSITSQGRALREKDLSLHLNLIQEDFQKVSSYNFRSEDDMSYNLCLINGRVYSQISINAGNRYQLLDFPSIEAFIEKMKLLNLMRQIVNFLARNVGSFLYAYVGILTLAILFNRRRKNT